MVLGRKVSKFVVGGVPFVELFAENIVFVRYVGIVYVAVAHVGNLGQLVFVGVYDKRDGIVAAYAHRKVLLFGVVVVRAGFAVNRRGIFRRILVGVHVAVADLTRPALVGVEDLELVALKEIAGKRVHVALVRALFHFNGGRHVFGGKPVLPIARLFEYARLGRTREIPSVSVGSRRTEAREYARVLLDFLVEIERNVIRRSGVPTHELVTVLRGVGLGLGYFATLVDIGMGNLPAAVLKRYAHHTVGNPPPFAVVARRQCGRTQRGTEKCGQNLCTFFHHLPPIGCV